MREKHCSECVGSVVGEHPRDWTEHYADGGKWVSKAHTLLFRPYVGCSLNSPAGMSIPRQTWGAIQQNAKDYCDSKIAVRAASCRGALSPLLLMLLLNAFLPLASVSVGVHIRAQAYDDAIHALQNARSAGEGQPLTRLLEPGWLTAGYPRCLHVGRCGGISFRAEQTSDEEAACNATADLATFARAWVKPMLGDGEIAVDRGYAAAANTVHEPFRDHTPCGTVFCNRVHTHLRVFVAQPTSPTPLLPFSWTLGDYARALLIQDQGRTSGGARACAHAMAARRRRRTMP